MFTGIIQGVGEVAEARIQGGGVRLTVSRRGIGGEVSVGDSICINGACQTIIEKTEHRVTVFAVEETLRKTTLGSLRPSSKVNVELPLRVGDMLGGHIVTGHVDCVGKVHSIEKRESSWIYRVEIPGEFTKYVVPVGSLAIDGVSLTVAGVSGSIVEVSIIPHTMDQTIFPLYRLGDSVNLEFDIIGKYVERLLGGGAGGGQVSRDLLRRWGYPEDGDLL